MKKLFSKKVAIPVLALIGVLIAYSLTLIPGIKFDYNYEHYFPKGDPDYAKYKEHIARFETDNDFFLIGMKNEAGIFEKEFLHDVDSLNEQLRRMDMVESVVSPTRFKNPIIGPFGVISPNVLNIDRPENYDKDSIRVFENPELVGSLFSPDAKSVSLLVRHYPSKDQKKKDAFTAAVENLVASYGFDESHVAGKIKGQYFFISAMKKELVLLIIASIALLLLILWFSFKSIWGIWVPLMVVGNTIIMILAFMVMVGKPIDLMSTVIPTILFVVGISNVIHIVEKYLEELRTGSPKKQSLIIAYRDIGLATILTALTTAIGFLSLRTSSIILVKEFGVFTAIGVFIALFLSFTFLPSCLILLKKPKRANKQQGELFWTKRLHRIFLWMLPRRKIIFIYSIIVFCLAVFGIASVKVDNSLLEDYATDEVFIADYKFFEKEFSGFRPFELSIEALDSNHNLMDYKSLLELQKLDSYLRDSFNCGFLISPLTFVKSSFKAMKGGNQEYYRLPTEKEHRRVKRNVRRLPKVNQRAFMSDDKMFGRFSGKVEDIGGYEMRKKNIKFYDFLAKEIDPQLIKISMTGMPYLIDKNNDSLASNILNGLLLAFSLIAIIMGLLFRSWKIVIISLLPNILPLLLITSFMGLLGIDLKIATSIIFTIAFGIAVDDTIHFMSKFRIELSKGKSTLYALKRTYLSTGKAIMVTTIILIAGFMTLLVSSIASNFYLGLLISLTLLFAVLSDLLFLPVLLLLFYRKKGTSSKKKTEKKEALLQEA